MLRDFSDAAKQKLLNYVDEVTANGTWDKVKEWFSNIEPNVQSWLGRLDIQKYVNSVECYYKKILDKNNSTKRQIEEIFRMCRQWIPDISVLQAARLYVEVTS